MKIKFKDTPLWFRTIVILNWIIGWVIDVDRVLYLYMLAVHIGIFLFFYSYDDMSFWLSIIGAIMCGWLMAVFLMIPFLVLFCMLLICHSILGSIVETMGGRRRWEFPLYEQRPLPAPVSQHKESETLRTQQGNRFLEGVFVGALLAFIIGYDSLSYMDDERQL